MSFSNLKSLLVSIPTRDFDLSTIGIPPILKSFMHFNASLTLLFLVSVTGSKIIPDSDLFTFLIFSACSFADKFL